jgi:hypothetical protein
MKTIKLAFAVLTAFLTGCSTIDRHEPVPGWPELKIVEYHVATQEMRDRCARFVRPWQFTEGCTLFHFDRAEAHIYVSKEQPSRFALDHERWHAAGYDHVGSTAMRRMLEAWKASRPSGI